MPDATITHRLTEMTEATRDALLDLETASAPAPRMEELARLQVRFHALYQVEASHLEPLLLTQAQSSQQALACKEARGRVAPLLEELQRTPVTDPRFDRILPKFAAAMRKLLDSILEMVSTADRMLSAEHRNLLNEVLDQATPAAC
jgi:hypothetical protein